MRSQLHGAHRGSQDFRGSLEAQAFLPEELVGGPLELGEGIDPLLDAPREAARVQEIVGGSRRSHRIVRHPIVVNRSFREQALLHATAASAVGHESSCDRAGPRHYRSAWHE